MTTLIENAVALADIAQVIKTTVARVEAEAHELDMFRFVVSEGGLEHP